MTTFPAITIWQPWATLIAEEAKPFEFRGWEAPRAVQGRRVAIHAGARPVRVAEVRALLVKLHGASWRETGLVRDKAIFVLERVKAKPCEFPTSAVVCLATLGQPLRDNDLARRIGVPEVQDSDRVEHSSWGWPLSEVERLQPFVPARGAQGWWRWQRVAA